MSQKVKAIYDALDHEQFKNAIKLCVALLQKQPGHALCKALQAVALERIGRFDEALQLCDEVWTSTPAPAVVQAGGGVDETVFSTVQVIYRRCRQHAKIMQMFDSAYAKEPDNEDYAVTLFIAAVRIGDYTKSQSVATKMFSKFKKPKYMHWVVVSMLMNVRSGGPAKTLDLAAMMLQKVPLDLEPLKKDDPVPFSRSRQYALLLHLTTLRGQGKCSQALEMLESAKGYMQMTSDVLCLRRQLMLEAGKPEECLKAAREEVLERRDDWASMQEYIALAFRCSVSSTKLPTLRWEFSGKSVDIPDHCSRLRPADAAALPDLPSMEDVVKHSTDDHVWNATLFVEHLLQLAKASTSQSSGSRVAERMSRLAALELRRRAFAKNEEEAITADSQGAATLKRAGWKAVASNNDLKDFMQGIQDYICIFGHRNSCLFDIKRFLCCLEESDVLPLLKAAEPSAPPGSKGETYLVMLQRIRHGCRRSHEQAALTPDAKEAQDMLHKWAEAHLATGATSGDDSGVMEDRVLLALVSLIEMDRACCSNQSADCYGFEGRTYLLDVIALAEAAVPVFVQCFHLRVLLVLLYGAIGLPSLALKHYFTLEIKNIQQESLSYMAMDALCTVGCVDTSKICRGIANYHEDVDKDGGDAIKMAFQSGVYHRIPEYVEFVQECSRSAVLGRASIEELLIELGQAQTWESLSETVAKQSGTLSTMCQRPIGDWVVKNQDRCILSGLHQLPLYSPLESDSAAATSNVAVPSASVQAGFRKSAHSAAFSWEERGSTRGSTSCSGGTDVGVAEFILTRGLHSASAMVKLSASTLCAVALLLQKEVDAKAVEDAIVESAKALECLGFARKADGGFEALDAAANGKGAAPWGIPDRLHLQSWYCGHCAAEIALSVLQCTASGTGWEQSEKKLVELTATTKSLLEGARDAASAEAGAALSLGGHGVPKLWTFLNGGAAVVIAVALWCTSALPKTSGKKVKEGQETLHATRVALKALFSTLQTGLADAQTDLSAACAITMAPEDRQDAAVPPKVAQLRAQTRETLAEAHNKHLQAIKETVSARLTLLKSRGAFKP